jgi:hypothetical protein
MTSTDILQIIFLLFLAAVYFWPTAVAYETPQRGFVFVLNLFLGWTFIGWVIALALAYKYSSEHNTAQNQEYFNKNRYKKRLRRFNK